MRVYVCMRMCRRADAGVYTDHVDLVICAMQGLDDEIYIMTERAALNLSYQVRKGAAKLITTHMTGSSRQQS